MRKFSKSSTEGNLRKNQTAWDEELLFNITVSVGVVAVSLYAWETIQSIVSPQRHSYTNSEHINIPIGRVVGDNVQVNGVDYSIDNFSAPCGNEPLFLSFQYDSDGLRRLVYISNKDGLELKVKE